METMAGDLSPNRASSKGADTVFFFGAGASVAAGVPATVAFVSELQNSLSEVDRKLCGDLLRQLQSQIPPDEPVDIELFIEALEVICWEHPSTTATHELLQPFRDTAAAKRLLSHAKEFIRAKVIVEANRIRYLDGLFNFSADGIIDIFSTNYDTAIERLCHTHRKSFCDGFDNEWSPESFSRPGTELRLYKLHGSVLWYQTQEGRAIRIPIAPEGGRARLFTSETAETLMIYPMRKWQYSEPLMGLMQSLKERLEDQEATRFVVVVGYSFRDEYILKLFWDAFRRNRDLRMLLIDPNAKQISDSRLAEYSPGVPSSMSGKVICIPAAAERVISRLRNSLISTLRQALLTESDSQSREREGQAVSWLSVADGMLKARHADGFKSAMGKAAIASEYPRGDQWEKRILFSYKAAALAASVGDAATTASYCQLAGDELGNLLKKAKIEVKCVGTAEGLQSRLEFNVETSKHSNSGLHQFANTMNDCLDYSRALIEERLGSAPTALASIHWHAQLLARNFDALKENVPLEDVWMSAFMPDPWKNPFGIAASGLLTRIAAIAKSNPNVMPADLSAEVAALEKSYITSLAGGLRQST